MTVVKIVGALVLAAIHLGAGKLRFLRVIPRSAWLSAAGGASVAYVFIHLLPELAHAQQTFAEHVPAGAALGERHIYLIALVGLAIFYGLERFVIVRSRSASDDDPGAVFWLHIGSFSLYNALIGYLLTDDREMGHGELSLFIVAMGLHFLVNDYGLREHHKELYDHRGRWTVAAAILLGAAVGFTVTIDEIYLLPLLAFLAGAVILNVLKEELPEERESRFWAFLVGAGGYTGLLLAL